MLECGPNILNNESIKGKHSRFHLMRNTDRPNIYRDLRYKSYICPTRGLECVPGNG